MECKECGSDGDVMDTDIFSDEVIVKFYCFNEDCPTYEEPQYIHYTRTKKDD